jgi:DNA-directed RNA polymerase subunit M/transcription elongation factor TFIIS
MEPTLPTPRPNLTTKTSAHKGRVRILAPPCEACPKCGDMNHGEVGRLYRVADERGCHLECDTCGHDTTR